MTDRTVRVVLTAEAKRLVDTVLASGNTLQRMGGQAAAAGAQATVALNKAEASAERFERRSNTMGRAIATAFGGLSLAAISRSAITAADDYTGLTGRVELFVNSQGAANEVIDQLYQRAQRARTPLIETGTLYVNLAGAAGELGASQADLMRFIGGVNASLAINKTAAGTAAGGLLQLGQMMGAPVVQAQEFNSLLDAMRPLLQAVANNLDGAGGSVSKLRTMVLNGQVATKDFFAAALKGSDELSAKADGMQSTVSQSITRINNAWIRYIGTNDQASGSTAHLSGLLNTVADDFDTVAAAAIDVGAIVVAAIAGRAVGGLVAAVAAQLRYAASIVETRNQAVLGAQATVAQTAAVVAEANAEVLATGATQTHTAALVRQAQVSGTLGANTRILAEAEAAHAAASAAHTAAVARQAAATAASAAATGAAAVATGSATLAVTAFRAVLAGLGGPVGIAITLLTGLAFWFMTSGDEADKAGGKIARSVDDALAKAKQMDAAKAGNFVSQEDLQDVQNLTTSIQALAVSYNALMTDITSGASLKGGRLAGDAAQADALLKRMQELRTAQDTILGKRTSTPNATAAPGASATATAEGELAKLRATLQAANAEASAMDDRRTASLDESLRRNLVGYRAYYEQRGQIEAAAVQREIANRSAELAQVASIRGATSAEKPKTDDQRDEQAKKLASLDADRVRLQGEINALKTKELTIGDQTQAQIAQAADDAEKKIADVRSQLAALQKDAGAVGAETRARMEREYKALLEDPSTSAEDKGRIRSLIDTQTVQAEFDVVRDQAASLMSDLRQQWDTLSQSVQAGTIGSAEAQSQYAAALDNSNPALQQFLAHMAELSQQLGPDAQREVQGLSTEINGLTLNLRTPLQQLAADWGDTFNQLQQVGVSSMRSVADELTSFVMTGKADVKGMALSIVQDLIRVMVQAQLTAAALKLGQTIGLVMSIGSAGAGAAGGGAAAGGGGMTSIGGTYTPTFAKGGILRGPGSGTSDSILARVSNGEAILTADTTRSLGSRLINLLNQHGSSALDVILAAANAPAFAQGGTIGGEISRSAGSSAASKPVKASGLQLNMPIDLHVGDDSGLDDKGIQAMASDLHTSMEATAERVIQKHLRARGALAR
jgi:tape measure domain-containing protein